MPFVPQLPIEPNDPKAIRALAKHRHNQNLGLTQDLGHVAGWIWSVVRRPFGLVVRVVRLVRR